MLNMLESRLYVISTNFAKPRNLRSFKPLGLALETTFGATMFGSTYNLNAHEVIDVYIIES